MKTEKKSLSTDLPKVQRDLVTTWLKRLYPLILFTGGVYVTLLAVKLFFFAIGLTAYSYIDFNHPAVITAYICVMHLTAMPFLYFSLERGTEYYIVFLVINGLCVLAIPISIIIVFTALPPEIKDLWKQNILNHFMLLYYFSASLALEVLVFFKVLRLVKQRNPGAFAPLDASSTTSAKSQLPKHGSNLTLRKKMPSDGGKTTID